jgi:hypothetical protein
MKRYRQIDPANSRIRGLIQDTVGAGMWRLLWMPPSLPYYELADEYAQPGISAITKRLVFSCWHVVPKVIAALVSYEAERNCILLHDSKAWNTPAARKKRPQLLRFSKSDGRLTGMPVVGLVYPGVALAEATDPLRFAANVNATACSKPNLSEAFTEAKNAVQTLLKEVNVTPSIGGAADEDWYWLAPLLMDLTRHRQQTLAWLRQSDIAAQWSGVELTPETDRENHWHEHVRTLNERAFDFLRGQLKLGPQPADLADVLAWSGLAGLGTCAYRSLRRMGFADEVNLHRNRAGQIAYAFLTLFNLPESTYLIRGSRGGEEAKEPYWSQVMQYCAGGCLQAVLDEYVHILRESLGRVDDTAESTVTDVAEEICGVLRLRTSRVGYDHITAIPRRNIVVTKSGMRVRFALRFGKEKADEGGDETREDQVRAAFNSPFWPFVLATTSIGQEGLDFHQYCHAIVHWNLPTNPVDLEQREGRIHRYKGHAIRKNVATRYGLPIASAGVDPWTHLFNQALCDCAASGSEIEPFWVFPIPDGATIERHVPVLPTSTDEQRLTFLRRAVSLYRLVFGQLRQEDMMRFLMEKLPAAEAERLAGQLPLNLEPPRVVEYKMI